MKSRVQVKALVPKVFQSLVSVIIAFYFLTSLYFIFFLTLNSS